MQSIKLRFGKRKLTVTGCRNPVVSQSLCSTLIREGDLIIYQFGTLLTFNQLPVDLDYLFREKRKVRLGIAYVKKWLNGRVDWLNGKTNLRLGGENVSTGWHKSVMLRLESKCIQVSMKDLWFAEMASNEAFIWIKARSDSLVYDKLNQRLSYNQQLIDTEYILDGRFFFGRQRIAFPALVLRCRQAIPKPRSITLKQLWLTEIGSLRSSQAIVVQSNDYALIKAWPDCLVQHGRKLTFNGIDIDCPFVSKPIEWDSFCTEMDALLLTESSCVSETESSSEAGVEVRIQYLAKAKKKIWLTITYSNASTLCVGFNQHDIGDFAPRFGLSERELQDCRACIAYAFLHLDQFDMPLGTIRFPSHPSECVAVSEVKRVFRHHTDMVCWELYRRLTEPIHESEEEQEENCVVCMDAKTSYAAIPCGHLAVCKVCQSGLSTCPMCRAPCAFQRIYRVFQN